MRQSLSTPSLNRTSFLLLLLTLLPSLLYANIASSLVTLQTALGQVTGVRKPAGNGSNVDVFYSIPFAQPPVGELRFKPPVPATPWKGAMDGTTRPKACWQSIDTSFDSFPGATMWNPDTELSEDCLYLNVFRPNTRKSRGSEPKPIMVWIFGGGFWSGSSSLDIYDATQLAVRNDVIVVSISYRVGPMGFLYLGKDTAPGNVGLLDQAMALQWVKDNAKNLGGSPDDMTIFGESSGAVSVGYHLMSPISRDLFTNAIMESASPVAKWSIQELDEARERAKRLADSLACSRDLDDSLILKCLQNTDPELLIEIQWELMESYFDVPLGPVVDGHFLPDHPATLLARGEIKTTNVLMGVNKDEGIFFDLYAFPDEINLYGDGRLTEAQFDRILPKIVPMKNVEDKVKGHYVFNTTSSFLDVVDDISGDVLFKCPVVNFAQAYTNLGGKVFMYSYEHRPSSNPWPEWMGMPHGYELDMVFGLPLKSDSSYDPVDKEISDNIMTHWTRFAHTGSPNKPEEITWPEYTNHGEEYIIIDRNGFRVDQKLRHDACAFLDTLTSNTDPEIDPTISVEIDLRPPLTIPTQAKKS